MLGRVRPALITIAFALLFMEACRLVMRWIFGHGDPAYDTFLFFLKSGIVLFLLFTTYGSVFNAIYQTGIALGLKAGGNVITATSFLDPGQYIDLGFKSGAPLWDKIRLGTIISADGVGIGYFIAWCFCIAAYILMAFTIFIAQVELSVAVVATAVMLPFTLYAPTHWMAQGTIAYPINKAFRLFILALLACAMFPLIKNELSFAPQAPRTLWKALTTFSTKPHESWSQACCLIMATWVLGLLYQKTSTIASSILSGRPALTGSNLLHSAIGTAVTAGAVVGGVTAGVFIGAGKTGGVIGLAAPQQGQGLAPSAYQPSPRSQGIARSASAISQGLIQGARYLSHD